MLSIENLRIKLGSMLIEIPRMDVERGDYVAIMGTSGAGKTALVEAIAGFHRIEGGEIRLNGERIDHLPPNRRNIAVVYQDYMLFPHMTVRENIMYPLRRMRKKAENVEDIVEMLGIGDIMDRYPGTLSGGEMQRCAIARALITGAEILLLDEPFSSLDGNTKSRARALVKNAVEKLHATVLHITHDVETAWLMANKVGIMHEGKMVQFGDIDEIFSRPSTEFVAEFVNTNILRGRVTGKKDMLTEVKVGGERIYISENAGGEVILSIRPENIILSKGEFESSMRNVLRGKIVRMERRGTLVWITIEFRGFSLLSVLTPNAIHALSIAHGDDVFVYFKASSVKVMG